MIQTNKIVLNTLVVMLGGLALAGCNTDSLGTGSLLAPTEPAAAAPAKPLPPAINMGGRWMLSSPGGGLCGMTFTTRGNGGEGSIAPEGGCPGEFYTSRSWTLAGDSLEIRNHKGKTLARLAGATPGSFQGNSVAGLPLTLTR